MISNAEMKQDRFGALGRTYGISRGRSLFSGLTYVRDGGGFSGGSSHVSVEFATSAVTIVCYVDPYTEGIATLSAVVRLMKTFYDEYTSRRSVSLSRFKTTIVEHSDGSSALVIWGLQK